MHSRILLLSGRWRAWWRRVLRVSVCQHVVSWNVSRCQSPVHGEPIDPTSFAHVALALALLLLVKATWATAVLESRSGEAAVVVRAAN